MPAALGWGEVLLRLGLAAGAGMIVGINRERHGRAAGLRTMLLVCTGAALSMILAQWMVIRGGGAESPAGSDPSRIAQGILAGMGFLGAGAIVRQGSTVLGVTTAASLWYVTILGLCFGVGCWIIGLVALGVALVALFLLPVAEKHLHADHYSTVTVVTRGDGPDDQALRRRLVATGVECVDTAIDYQAADRKKTIRFGVQYRADQAGRLPGRVVAEFSRDEGVIEVKWE